MDETEILKVDDSKLRDGNQTFGDASSFIREVKKFETAKGDISQGGTNITLSQAEIGQGDLQKSKGRNIRAPIGT